MSYCDSTSLVSYDIFKSLDKPLVNLCQFLNALDGVAVFECLGDGEYTQVGRVGECVVKVVEAQVVVAYEAVHALTYHAESFLDYLLKRLAD